MSHYSLKAMLILILLFFFSDCANATELKRGMKMVQADVPGIGLNLGAWGSWGADQLMHNVIKNPGFEPVRDRTLVVISDIQGDRVLDDTGWLKRAPNFWSGGSYYVLTGVASGKQGRVLTSGQTDKEKPDGFLLSPFPTGLGVGDCIMLETEILQPGIPMWWSHGRIVSTEISEREPGLPKNQVARLHAQMTPVQLISYLDTIFERGGKLLPVNGKWHFSVWVKRKSKNASLKVKFQRQRSRPFLDVQIDPESEWKKFEFEFSAQDNGPKGSLELIFSVEHGEVLLDDVQLSPLAESKTGFDAEVVRLLRALKPGYLRDWQGQLGDSFANRVAPVFERKPTRYRPGDSETLFLYGLDEFMRLCAEIGAQPWVTGSGLWRDDEWEALAHYLRKARQQWGFKEVLVEFGNENWNTIFRPGGYTNQNDLIQRSNRAFAILREKSGNPEWLKTVLGAQYVNAGNWQLLALKSKYASHITVAPYFLYKLDTDNLAEAENALFRENEQLLIKNISTLAAGKHVNVYEVNFHTTSGTASADTKNQVLTNAASGVALAKRLMQTTLSGVREQAVYSLSGLDTYDDQRRLIKLFGITSVLRPATLRPTGQALLLLNRMMVGDIYPVSCESSSDDCSYLTGIWSVHKGQPGVALASSSAKTIHAEIQLPCQGQAELLLLNGSQLQSGENNENSEQRGKDALTVRVSAFPCGKKQLTIPAYSLLVISSK